MPNAYTLLSSGVLAFTMYLATVESATGCPRDLDDGRRLHEVRVSFFIGASFWFVGLKTNWDPKPEELSLRWGEARLEHHPHPVGGEARVTQSSA